MRRFLLALGASLWLVVVLIAPAAAKSYSLPSADVIVEVQSDGSLLISETLVFSFDGSFSGAYRDISVGGGQSVSEIQVFEGEVA